MATGENTCRPANHCPLFIRLRNGKGRVYSRGESEYDQFRIISRVKRKTWYDKLQEFEKYCGSASNFKHTQ